MEWEKEHETWKIQIHKLIESKNQLRETEPLNILVHFFSQVVEAEFKMELDANKSNLKILIRNAIEMAVVSSSSPRLLAAQCVYNIFKEPILDKIRLADLRNIIVFEIYKRCGITLDTYFERYSSPPGTEAQNAGYSKIAHGNAMCTAENVVQLNHIVVFIFVLKRLFSVYDVFVGKTTEMQPDVFNWIGHAWACHVSTKCLSDLVWSTYLDLWEYEQIVFKDR